MSAPATKTQNRQQVATIDERSVSFVPFGAAARDELTITIGMVRNIIAVKTKSGKEPSDAQIMKFMMLCKARQLNPYEGDAFLIGYDNQDGTATFSLITAHQAFLKRAEVNPHYDGMESGVIVNTGQGEIIERQGDFLMDGETLLGGWAKVHLKNRSIPTYRRLNLRTFQKKTKIWYENPAGQIVKCAEADSLRSSFPTVLGGMYLEQVMDHEHQDQQPKRPAQIELIRAKLAELPQKRGNGSSESSPITEEAFDPPKKQEPEFQPGELVDAEFEPSPREQAELSPVVDEYQVMLANMRQHIQDVDPSGLAGMLELVKEHKNNGDIKDEDYAALVKQIEARQAAPGKHKRGPQ